MTYRNLSGEVLPYVLEDVTRFTLAYQRGKLPSKLTVLQKLFRWLFKK